MKKLLGNLGIALGLCLTSIPLNAATFFADDFEASGASGATTLSAPWQMNKEVFNSSNAYLGGYYPGSTFGPNAVVAGGAGGSAFSGKVWPDYGYAPDWAPGNKINVSLLVNQTLTASDIAPGVIQMDFSYLRDANPGANATAFAWMRLLAADYSAVYWQDTFQLAVNGDWSRGSAKMTFDGTQAGLHLQYGFTVVDADYSGNAGLLVDNITVSNVPEPSSAALMGLGVAGLLAFRLRRKL
jgi:hypothetical protein